MHLVFHSNVHFEFWIDNATYDFVWYFNGNPIPNSNNATLTATAVGTYGVIATNSVTNCPSSDESDMVTALLLVQPSPCNRYFGNSNRLF